jgi:hypothetical protein
LVTSDPGLSRVYPDKLVYFPYINVPANEWFNRVLLYWDQVVTITPSEYIGVRAAFSTHTAGLLDLGLVKATSPPENLTRAPAFYEGFLRVLESSPHAAEPGAPAHLVPMPLHTQKMGRMLAEELQQRHLATRILSTPNMYAIEAVTAEQFMAYLAAVLAEMLGPDYTAGTDEKRSLAALSLGFSGRPSVLYADENLREVVLADVLPAPETEIQPRQLMEFKERYSEQLGRFRRRVERGLLEISLIPGWDQRRTSADLLAEQLREERDEVAAMMNEKKLGLVKNGTLLSVFSAAVSGSHALATGEPVSTATSILSLAAAAAASIWASSRSPESRSPMAYAALAQKHLAVN